MSLKRRLRSVYDNIHQKRRNYMDKIGKERGQSLNPSSKELQHPLETNRTLQSSKELFEDLQQLSLKNRTSPSPEPFPVNQPPDTNEKSGFPKSFSGGSRSLYRPLNANEIRVLEILPGLDDDIIQCKLHYVTLGADYQYHSLSYTWGDLSLPRASIVVDGQELAVTENCRDALQELRREVIIKVLWVDAVCINQADFEERSSQVSLMGSIYQLASGLVIWLGREADRSEEAFVILKEAFARFEIAEPSGRQQLLVELEEHPQIMDQEHILKSLFRRPWFVRVWVLQEFIISCATSGEDETIFYCGASRLSAAQMAITMEIFQLYKLADHNPEATAVVSLFAMYESAHNLITHNSSHSDGYKPALNLLSLILEGYDLEATNPLDRIYAHLGYIFGIHRPQSTPTNILPLFSRDPHQATQYATDRGLIIDYTRSTIDVYASLIRFICFERESLNILSPCSKLNNYPERTWTLNLELYDNGTNPTLLGESLEDSAPVRSSIATGSAASAAIAEVSFSADLAVVSVQGIKIDRIQHFRESFSSFSFYKDISAFGALVQAMIEQGAYPDAKVAADIIWETWTNEYDQEEGDVYSAFRWLYRQRPVGDDFQVAWSDKVKDQPNRELYITEMQIIVKAWNNCQEGDCICIIPGCDVPLVLREVGDHYELIGDCYLRGYMEAEEMEKTIEERSHELVTFDLR